MKVYIVASLIFGLLSVGVLAQDDSNDTESKNTTTVEPTTTPESNTTTTSAGNTTTTSAEITTTTPESNTTSPSAGNTTTTSAEITTTSSTTPEPTPPNVNPDTGDWNVTSGNITCIRLVAAIQFQFIYEQENGVFEKTKLNIPQHAHTDEKKSSCEQHIISLTFDNNTFSLKFAEENEKVIAKQANITYFYSNETFPGAKNLNQTGFETADNLTLFKVAKGKSYLCKAESKIDFGGNVTGSLTKVQVEAFKNSTNPDFSTADECSSDEKISDIVPIAVGCALAALVIIVLIAYLVGRQRTRQRGYQSV